MRSAGNEFVFLNDGLDILEHRFAFVRVYT